MRQYELIWVKLKTMPREDAEHIGISITANSRLHKRIIKAVIKEKWKDLGFKLLLDGYVTELEHSRSFSILTFYLKYKKSYRPGDF